MLNCSGKYAAAADVSVIMCNPGHKNRSLGLLVRTFQARSPLNSALDHKRTCSQLEYTKKHSAGKIHIPSASSALPLVIQRHCATSSYGALTCEGLKSVLTCETHRLSKMKWAVRTWKHDEAPTSEWSSLSRAVSNTSP